MKDRSSKPHVPSKSRQEEQDDLTEQGEESFPASDPPSLTQPSTGAGAPGGHKSAGTGVEAELARQQAKEKEHKT